MAASRARHVVVSTCFVAAVLGAGVAAWSVVTPADSAPASARQTPAPATTTITKGDLTDTKVFSGSLGFDRPVPLPGSATGTVTWLPEPGKVIARDQPLYAVDEHPVRAMYGSVPLWRDLTRGAEGADVHQLNENLAALGYGVSVDDVFGPRTERAVRQWQEHHGLTVDGSLGADDIAFVPGEVRVASRTAQLGAPVNGDVLQLTGTTPVALVTVQPADEQRLAVGTTVSMRIGGVGDPVEGAVVDTRQDEDQGDGTVEVTIAFDPGDRDVPQGGSVQVTASGQSAHDVLSVPVAALVAGDGKAFALDVVRSSGATERVPVTVSFVAEGRAAIDGAVRQGDRVVMPS
ncbi:peptidoglycan-binding protein [Curtobacterium citreum]|uniref:Peptidoglycan-binding protein n=1 Tax=Curtobacterium citreum TaxID=2036 RepID=A0ABT2HIU6_9MICO|nr:peptidoglycan-binding protein [Curtobacterium citreum]MCS6523174.1 peptidoglycan-binding protein [Curtobacterium citreum]TQJ26845.1 putative peptidoglycan binding protein [Curtobacterium citreum]